MALEKNAPGETREIPAVSPVRVVELAELALSHFRFDSDFSHRAEGTAVGSPMSR